MPVVTSDHPAMFPASSSINRSSIPHSFQIIVVSKLQPAVQIQQELHQHHIIEQRKHCIQAVAPPPPLSPSIIISIPRNQKMKQNQSLFRPFPGENTSIKHHDLLHSSSSCTCSRCLLIKDEVNPEITIDSELNALRANRSSLGACCDHVVFLNELRRAEGSLPRFRFLDTIVLEKGEAGYAIYFQEGKAKICQSPSIKSWIVERKEQLDLRYQIKKYEREHPQFHFAAFEHESEKRIKEFQNNIKYKMPPILNKVAILKLRGMGKEEVISKSEFEDLFSMTKQKMYQIGEIEYIQVFPVMYGEEDHSYERSIKFFRAKAFSTKSFKLAQSNVITWREKNESIEKLEEKVFAEISDASGEAVTEDMRLEYMTHKILIYFEELSNLRIEEAIVKYLTNDQGRTFYFRTIECIKLERRVAVSEMGSELPSKKDIPKEDHIVLGAEMNKLFSCFQEQFHRLDKERRQMEEKLKKDKEYSNFVYQTVTRKNAENLHTILQSNNQKYKKDHLKL